MGNISLVCDQSWRHRKNCFNSVCKWVWMVWEESVIPRTRSFWKPQVSLGDISLQRPEEKCGQSCAVCHHAYWVDPVQYLSVDTSMPAEKKKTDQFYWNFRINYIKSRFCLHQVDNVNFLYTYTIPLSRCKYTESESCWQQIYWFYMVFIHTNFSIFHLLLTRTTLNSLFSKMQTQIKYKNNKEYMKTFSNVQWNRTWELPDLSKIQENRLF